MKNDICVRMDTNVHLCVCYSLILDLVLWYCKIIVYLTVVKRQ